LSTVPALFPYTTLFRSGACAAGAAAGPRRDHVVDSEHHDRRVGGGRDRLTPDPDRLDHVLLLHVGDLTGEDVHAGVLVPLLVFRSEEHTSELQSRVDLV